MRKKNLENPKTPLFDDLAPGKGIVSEKKQASHAHENASNCKVDNQKKLSTDGQSQQDAWRTFNRRVFKTAYNMRDVMPDMERFRKPSLTQPDEALSVEEVMRRLTAGIPVNAARELVFNGDEVDLPDFEKMDLSERHDYAESVRKAVKDNQEKADKIRQQKQDKRREKLVAREAQKLFEQMRDNGANPEKH